MADGNKVVPQKGPLAIATDQLRDNGYAYVGAFTGAGTPIFEYKSPSSDQTVGIQKSAEGIVLYPDFEKKKEALSSGTSVLAVRVEPTPDSSFRDEFVKRASSRGITLPNETAVAQAPEKKKTVLQ